MSQSRKERRQQERTAKKSQSNLMSNEIFYIGFFDAQTGTYATFDLEKSDWDVTANSTEMKQFSTKILADYFANNYKNPASKVTAIALVQRELIEGDKNIIAAVKEQKHSAFILVVDKNNDRKTYMFASSTCDNLEEADKFCNAVGSMYLETCI